MSKKPEKHILITEESEDFYEYQTPLDEPHYNKGGHRERSKAHDNRKHGHGWFWQRKENNKKKP